jgi:hypothetical protein
MNTRYVHYNGKTFLVQLFDSVVAVATIQGTVNHGPAGWRHAIVRTYHV